MTRFFRWLVTLPTVPLLLWSLSVSPIRAQNPDSKDFIVGPKDLMEVQVWDNFVGLLPRSRLQELDRRRQGITGFVGIHGRHDHRAHPARSPESGQTGAQDQALEHCPSTLFTPDFSRAHTR